jgi:hypothetical protein
MPTCVGESAAVAGVVGGGVEGGVGEVGSVGGLVSLALVCSSRGSLIGALCSRCGGAVGSMVFLLSAAGWAID